MVRALGLAAVLVLPLGISAQEPNGSGATRASVVTAIRAAEPPVIDGRDDDAVWQRSPAVGAFRQLEPDDAAEPSLPTEFRVAYDERNLFIFVRAFDTSPDSIRRALSRRDVRGPSDQIQIFIDSEGARRTGFEFVVNPDGVKRDFAVYDDERRDGTWNGVWYVATLVDSLGWTAEFRIPLSQLRYPDRPSHDFGVAVFRDIERYRERVSWPAMSRDRAGMASQAGIVPGLEGLTGSRSVELVPYAVTRSEARPRPGGLNRVQSVSVGADLRLRVNPTITLDATVNPDFGQVEADPAVLNLTAFETFFGERRPFFVEDTRLYRFGLNCYIVVDCSTNEGLFYSRRIGRSPVLRELNGDNSTRMSTPIAAAAKLAARTTGGLSMGILNAVTGRVEGSQGRTAEPRANYLLVSAEQRLRGGEADIRLLGTAVHRALDASTAPHLHDRAFAGGLAFRNRMFEGNYEFTGMVAGSQVDGEAAAIARTQTGGVHYFQQPDAGLEFDPRRTTLRGHAAQLKFGKYGGGITRFETSYVRFSPGFEVNDLGYLRRAGHQDWSTWASLRFNTPGRFYRWASFNGNHWQTWTTSGTRLETSVNANGHAGLHNNWDVHAGATLSGIGTTFCDRCTRGGPMLRRDLGFHPWFGINADNRRMLIPAMWVNLNFTDAGRSHSTSLRPELGIRISGNLDARIGGNFASNLQDAQWVGNFVDTQGNTHYTFARLDQTTRSITLRLNYTVGPDLTFELYGEPFVSTGTFTNFREVSSTPRAAEYDRRFLAYVPPASTPTSFRSRQLRTNAVLRWEYLPGSTLFLVWSHGREGSDQGPTDRSFVSEYRDLWELRPEHTFLVKVAYWFNR